MTYPLSTFTSYPLTIVDNIVTAKISVSLSPVDRQLVVKFRPSIDIGGTYNTKVVASSLVYLSDGLEISQIFTDPVLTVATIAAAAWQAAKITAVGDALVAARAVDAGITFGTLTYTQA